MFLKAGIATLLLVLQYLNVGQCQTYKEGYLVNNPDADEFENRCLVQVTDTKEGTKEFTGEPWNNDTNCDLIVLRLTEGSSFDNGSFTIQIKSTGDYVSEVYDHIGLSSTQEEFAAYIHGEEEEVEEDCGCPLLYNKTAPNNLLNESYHIHLRFHNSIGPRCLNDMFYYDIYGEDSYGYLLDSWPSYLLSNCFTDWWFVEVNITDTTTTDTNTVQADAQQGQTTESKSNSDGLAIGLSVGLILAAVACAAVIVLVVCLIKKKKKNQTESAPDAPTEATVKSEV